MRSCKCPECGATISFTDSTLLAECEFCKTLVDLSDHRSVKIIEKRKVDEAAIIMAKTRARELELEAEREKRQAEKEKRQSKGKSIAIIAWIMLIALLWIASQFTDDFLLKLAPLYALIIGGTMLLPNKNNKP